MRILIAEDDATSRLILTARLQQAGHEVVAVENGARAWTAWREQLCPVLITDWLMPEMDGFDLCLRIRNTAGASYTYIIVLTAHGGKTNCLEAMDAGADDFMAKPPDQEELLARLRVAERILSLREHVKRLEGVLPICSYCKKIRDEHGRWDQLETYVTEHSEAWFSHGICPECLARVTKESRLEP
jgi:phosphoserine phosphatase RsbU/P